MESAVDLRLLGMIFVQVAAYRDPELGPTLESCFKNAKFPDSIRFGILLQSDSGEETAGLLQASSNCRVKDVHWAQSKGLGWARSEAQKLYEGEEYTLQIDSHHRFAKDWDVSLIRFLEQCPSNKPIVTSYAGIYNAETGKLRKDPPYKMVADKFTPSGTILFRPHYIREWRELDRPIPARFVSGHFYFTLGRHCEEYHYDPQLYFAGDEISLSIRSFTLGYDLFHPHRNVIWHEYSRKGRPKHWDDHVRKNAEQPIEVPWGERDKVSKKRLRALLKEEPSDIDLGIYGLGNVRSHADYERYAGIDFANRRLSPETIAGENPSLWVQGQE